MKIPVRLGAREYACRVAYTEAERRRGLQGVALGAGEGMLFPFTPVQSATFYMGSVAYPISLLFVDAGRVAKVVHASPGDAARWSYPRTAAVLEVPRDFSLRVGLPLTYNLPRTLVDVPTGGDGHFFHETPQGPSGDERGEERFKDHRLPDESDPNAMDQPTDGWRQQLGPFPSEGWDGVVGPIRGAVERPEAFVAALLEGMARVGGLLWQEDTLNGGITEACVITPKMISSWLTALGMNSSVQSQALQEALSPGGLGLLADGLVLGGFADNVQVHGTSLVARRSRRQ